MSDLFVVDVARYDVVLVEALLVDEGHGEVELLGQDARPPRAALVRGADHGLLPVGDILLDPSEMFRKLFRVMWSVFDLIETIYCERLPLLRSSSKTTRNPPPFLKKCKSLSLCPSSYM